MNDPPRPVRIEDISNTHFIKFLERKKRESGTEKVFEEIMGVKFSKLAKSTSTDSRSWWKPEQDKPKEIHAQTNQSNFLKLKIIFKFQKEQDKS